MFSRKTNVDNQQWSFDVSSFMVLLGEGEEVNYRLMRRSLLECLVACPVAGLQSYMRSHYALADMSGATYIDPLSRKTAPLRNMRLAQTITLKKILRDSHCLVYQIPHGQLPANFLEIDLHIFCWTAFTWLLIAGLFTFLILMPTTTWIGLSNCMVLTGLGVFLRLAEAYVTSTAVGRNSRPQDPDANILLGRRESCFVIEGSREDVCRWTGLGVTTRNDRFSRMLRISMRLLSFLGLLFVFVTIPNGTIPDQIAFILISSFSQVNVKVGQHLNARSCLALLETRVNGTADTRTHIYAFLIRRFGDGSWVDDVNLLPRSEAWNLWRREVVHRIHEDAKVLYNECEARTRFGRDEKNAGMMVTTGLSTTISETP